MKHPTSSACFQTPEPAPAHLHSKQPPVLVSRWSALLTHAAARSSALGHLAHSSPAVPVACQVAEGLDLYLPYLTHIWRLARIKTVCAWKLPSKTALYQWTFMRPKRCGEKNNSQHWVSTASSRLPTHTAPRAYAP